jgi:uncharacterized protein (DUF2141 family)
MKKSALVCALLLAPVVARAEEKAVLVVTVQNISSKGGELKLALYDRKNFDKGEGVGTPAAGMTVPAKPLTETVTFDPVPPGTYAVKMYQDDNSNGRFDLNWLGLPAERYGFSNDAGPDWIHLTSPSFDAAGIVLKPGRNAISIWLQ